MIKLSNTEALCAANCVYQYYGRCASPFTNHGNFDARCHGLSHAATYAAYLYPATVKELALLRGAMAADDERLRVAGERVGIEIGCDTAEWLADEIVNLRGQLATVQELVSDLVGWSPDASPNLPSLMSKLQPLAVWLMESPEVKRVT